MIKPVMNNFIEVHVVRVFVDGHGKFGNPVGIIFDENNRIQKKERQAIAAKLNYSETVFVNNLGSVNLSIYNPVHEVRFAGHAMVGASWLISKTKNHQVDSMTCSAGRIKTRKEGDRTWVRASVDMLPPWKYEQFKNPEEVERSLPNRDHTFVWAWLDRDKGVVRARTFAPDWGIPEDEANGSGSMKLAATLRRELEIHHGKGSIIYAKPWKIKWADVGGRVIENPLLELI